MVCLSAAPRFRLSVGVGDYYAYNAMRQSCQSAEPVTLKVKSVRFDND